MAKSEAHRQKQLAKKKAKRQEKRTQLARLTSKDPTVCLAQAGSWPIVDALVPENLFDLGIGQLLLARRHPDGGFACGVFLVDCSCLGVKSAFWDVLSKFEYDKLIRKCEGLHSLRRVTPEYFAKLIYDAVQYAQSFGFAPDPEYRHVQLLLKGIDASLCFDTFEFGKDGKPFYVRGPHESLATAQSIATQIQNAGGH